MLPLLLISTLPAFTLLLVAPPSYKACKLVRELGLVALLLARELLRHSVSTVRGRREQGARMPPSKAKAVAAREDAPAPALAGEAEAALPVLDLPELALDRVLEELSPASLAAMACVCVGLRDRCSMDSLWERHVRRKWGRVLGAAARKEWEAELSARRSATTLPHPARRRSWVDSLACAWPFSWIGCRWLKGDSATPAAAATVAAEPAPAPPVDTVAAWYRALECGEFWFPAQVYNREVPASRPETGERGGRRAVEQDPHPAGEHAGARSPCFRLPGGGPASRRPLRDPVEEEQGFPLRLVVWCRGAPGVMQCKRASLSLP